MFDGGAPEKADSKSKKFETTADSVPASSADN